MIKRTAICAIASLGLLLNAQAAGMDTSRPAAQTRGSLAAPAESFFADFLGIKTRARTAAQRGGCASPDRRGCGSTPFASDPGRQRFAFLVLALGLGNGARTGGNPMKF